MTLWSQLKFREIMMTWELPDTPKNCLFVLSPADPPSSHDMLGRSSGI